MDDFATKDNNTEYAGNFFVSNFLLVFFVAFCAWFWFLSIDVFRCGHGTLKDVAVSETEGLNGWYSRDVFKKQVNVEMSLRLVIESWFLDGYHHVITFGVHVNEVNQAKNPIVSHG